MTAMNGTEEEAEVSDDGGASEQNQQSTVEEYNEDSNSSNQQQNDVIKCDILATENPKSSTTTMATDLSPSQPSSLQLLATGGKEGDKIIPVETGFTAGRESTTTENVVSVTEDQQIPPLQKEQQLTQQLTPSPPKQTNSNTATSNKQSIEHPLALCTNSVETEVNVSNNSCPSSHSSTTISDSEQANSSTQERNGVNSSDNISNSSEKNTKYINSAITNATEEKESSAEMIRQEIVAIEKTKDESMTAKLTVTNSSSLSGGETYDDEKAKEKEVSGIPSTVFEFEPSTAALATSPIDGSATTPIESLQTENECGSLTIAPTQQQQQQQQQQSLSASPLPPPPPLPVPLPMTNLSEAPKNTEGSAASKSSSAHHRKRKSSGKAAGKQDTISDEFNSLKRRKINAAGAPKMPLTGYVRYMNDRREELRRDYPQRSSMEHTKMIGEEWQALSAERRAPYMKAAELDKIRYNDELNAFLKSRPDILASELAKNKQAVRNKLTENQQQQSSAAQAKDKMNPGSREKAANRSSNGRSPNPFSTQQNAHGDKLSKRKRTPTPPNGSQSQSHNKVNRDMPTANGFCPPPAASTDGKDGGAGGVTTLGGFCSSSSSSSSSTKSLSGSSGVNNVAMMGGMMATSGTGEIPIFTHEFLDHNRTYDLELKALRKSKTDLEQQNAVLEKYVENMKCGVHKLITENDELQQKNQHLELYLDKLKRKLANALSTLPLPSAPNGATVDNIDKYMQELYRMSTANTHGPATLNKAKDIIRKLDLHIQL